MGYVFLKICADLLEIVDVDNLMMQAKRFIDNINNIQTSVDSGNLSDPKKFHPSDRVLQVVLPILPEARKKAGYLKDHLEAMTKTYDDLLTYYGEDHADETSRKRFFKMISDFVKNYKVRFSFAFLMRYANLGLYLGIQPEEFGTRR